MAEIDKALPNVKQTVKLPSPQEVQEQQQQQVAQEMTQPADIQQNEDGSVDISLILMRLIQVKQKTILQT